MTVTGITIANSAAHSIDLAIGYKPDHPDDLIRWVNIFKTEIFLKIKYFFYFKVKIFTWRANGDGLGSSGNQIVEDCFVRTQAESSTAES